jgi:hypothetical protein
MRYIGTSLGGCLRSLLAEEVSEEDVLFIGTRTNCPTLLEYVEVVKNYHSFGNDWVKNPERYKLSAYPWDEVLSLAVHLYENGKIHQPRLYSEYTTINEFERVTSLWLEVVPTNTNTTPAVVNAYEHYRMLDKLTQHE